MPTARHEWVGADSKRVRLLHSHLLSLCLAHNLLNKFSLISCEFLPLLTKALGVTEKYQLILDGNKVPMLQFSSNGNIGKLVYRYDSELTVALAQ